MKVKLNEEELFEISEVDMKLLAHDLQEPEQEIRARLKYIISHKCEQCFRRMRDEWLERLQRDPKVTHVPVQRDEFVKFVTSHKDYKNRVQRDAEMGDLI